MLSARWQYAKSDFLSWGCALVVGTVSGCVAIGWLGLSGTDAWVIEAAFILTAVMSRAFSGRSTAADSAMMRQTQSDGAELIEGVGRLLSECAHQFLAQYSNMRDEVARLESLLADAISTLTLSFNGMHELGNIRRQLVLSTSNNSNGGNEREAGFERTADNLAQEVSRAVTALQFQDMASQLMGHLKKRIDALDGTVRRFGDLASTLRQHANQHDTRDAVAALQQEVVRMQQRLADLATTTSHNPVSQSAMSHGDVELF